MIVLHTGKLGVGKSYWATREVWSSLENGIDCYVNWDIDFTDYYLRYRKSIRFFLRRLWCWYTSSTPYFGRLYRWETFDDLYSLRRGICFFDEAHTMVSSLDWDKLPKDFVRKISQSRKHKLDMHFITQHSAQVVPTVRRLCNCEMRHYRFLFLHYWLLFDGDQIEKMMSGTAQNSPRSIQKGFYFLNKRLANCYNSWVDFGEWPESKLTPVWSVAMIPDILALRGTTQKVKGRQNTLLLFIKYLWSIVILPVTKVSRPKKESLK
jgi:hypothetical protein